MIPMKNSDVLDRWTILNQKIRFTEAVKQEKETFDREVSKIIKDIDKKILFIVIEAIAELQEANAKIWLLESAVRKEFSKDPTSAKELTREEIGDRAIMIRDFNKLRIHAKDKIDLLFSQTSDIKVNHLSDSA